MTKLKPNQFKIFSEGITITERPILFSTDMVRANLKGRKTQTRRICKHQNWSFSEVVDVNTNGIAVKVDKSVTCPYGKSGDLIWVRETVSKFVNRILYRADVCSKHDKPDEARWKPSIHMPKAAARIWLMVEEIKVERLQDISDEDAIAEGVFSKFPMSDMKYLGDSEYIIKQPFSPNQFSFMVLWCKINGWRSWDTNPWVWVVKYRIISKTGKPCLHTIEKNYLEVTGKNAPAHYITDLFITKSPNSHEKNNP